MAPPSRDETSAAKSPAKASQPESPSEPSSPPAPPSQPLSPLFLATAPPPSDDPSTSSQLPPSSGLPGMDPTSPSDGADSPSGPRSTGKARLRELREMARAAVATAGGLAHQLLTRPDTPEREVGLYMPDKEDVEAIGDPLASLASRRMPEGAANPDAVDLVRVVLGLVGYAGKQIQKRAELTRQWLEQQVDPEEPDGQTGPDEVVVP